MNSMRRSTVIVATVLAVTSTVAMVWFAARPSRTDLSRLQPTQKQSRAAAAALVSSNLSFVDGGQAAASAASAAALSSHWLSMDAARAQTVVAKTRP